MESFVKVIDVQVLTLASREGIPEDKIRPLIRFELEDGREFLMAGIPHEIAFNLSLAMNNMETQDSRIQIHELVGQLAVIEKVEIDLVLPNTDVYQATIYLTMEGFQKQLTFQMIPSHATLLAVLNDAEIFVADTLVKQALAMRTESID